MEMIIIGILLLIIGFHQMGKMRIEDDGFTLWLVATMGGFLLIVAGGYKLLSNALL